MSGEIWAILGVGAVIALIQLFAASETEKRLNRIITILINIEQDVDPRRRRD